MEISNMRVVTALTRIFHQRSSQGRWSATASSSAAAVEGGRHIRITSQAVAASRPWHFETATRHWHQP